ncbi:MAG: molybdopterin/thiamine biosynthesis adenylyltransferase, partial [Candidatus Krumholzibacteriia bacterium]
GEVAVWVGVSARHRADAFQACRYLIDEIKHRLPVWKKEHYVEGPAEWVDCEGCHHHEPLIEASEYYKRQLTLPEFGELEQEKLATAKVLVVGAGGLGCGALPSLVGAGVGEITICDPDQLEVTNLHRQHLYDHRDVGQFKASLAAQRMAGLNPLLKIKSLPEKFDEQNAMDLVSAHDIVVDGTDNFAAKFLMHDVCFAQKKVLVQGAIYQYEGQLQVFDFRDSNDAGCLRCAWPEVPAADCVDSCADAGVLGAVPAMLGNMQALETIKAIVGSESPATSGTILIELESLSMSTIKRPKLSTCALCSDGADPYAVTAPATPEWEVTLAEFKLLHPQGEVIDIRSLGTKPSLDTYCVGWASVPTTDKARLFDAEFSGQSLLVCDRGVSSSNLTEELHSAGHTNFWSLKGGATALK